MCQGRLDFDKGTTAGSLIKERLKTLGALILILLQLLPAVRASYFEGFSSSFIRFYREKGSAVPLRTSCRALHSPLIVISPVRCCCKFSEAEHTKNHGHEIRSGSRVTATSRS